MTLNEVLKWLEEDGYKQAAADLLKTEPAAMAAKAREIADHCEAHPRYRDVQGKALPDALRRWATEREPFDTAKLHLGRHTPRTARERAEAQAGIDRADKDWAAGELTTSDDRIRAKWSPHRCAGYELRWVELAATLPKVGDVAACTLCGAKVTGVPGAWVAGPDAADPGARFCDEARTTWHAVNPKG